MRRVRALRVPPRAQDLFCFRAPLSETLTSFSRWGREGNLGVPIGLQRFSGPWFLEGSKDPSFLIIFMIGPGGLKFC